MMWNDRVEQAISNANRNLQGLGRTNDLADMSDEEVLLGEVHSLRDQLAENSWQEETIAAAWKAIGDRWTADDSIGALPEAVTDICRQLDEARAAARIDEYERQIKDAREIAAMAADAAESEAK